MQAYKRVEVGVIEVSSSEQIHLPLSFITDRAVTATLHTEIRGF